MRIISRRTDCPRWAAFTLVELLVVITIIGILIALLLPAVQAAREAARRTQCSNNFKQVGLALHNYHGALKTFPMGLNMWPGGGDCANPGIQTRYYGVGWAAVILPYLEQKSVYDAMDFREDSYDGTMNFAAGAKFIPAYLCPSDPQGEDLTSCCSGHSNGPSEYEDLAKTNMAGVADSVNWGCGTYPWPRPDGNGVLYGRSKVRIGQISDGTSHTLAVGEIIGGGAKSHSGFFWSTWDILDTHNGINYALQIGESYNPWNPEFNGFTSYHPGGCHFVIADGSVQFVSETIDQNLLAALTTRRGSEATPRAFE